MARATSYVFDLDGTISDPAAGIGRSLDYALRHFGYPGVSDHELPRFIGPPLDQTFRLLVGNVPHPPILALVAKYRERYADIGFAENELYPGMAEAIGRLDAAGVDLGICTSKRADLADMILRRFGIRHHFRFISGGDIGITKEQQLACLLEERLIDPSSVMIGDRAVDVLAAKANGIASIAVLWGYGSRDELDGASPDRLVASPDQLIGAIAVERGIN